MAATYSTMLPLGTEAPNFDLPVATGGSITLADFSSSKALLVMFICNHCPYVIHLQDQIKALTDEYQPRGVGVVAINSNDVEKFPEDGPEKMRVVSESLGYTFPYAFDREQVVAKAYQAACTPEFYVFDGDRKLVYRGQMDGSRPGNNIAVTGEDLRAALDAALTSGEQSTKQIPSMGCNIKWRPGNEPSYA